jgi:signal transduction histidine kinase
LRDLIDSALTAARQTRPERSFTVHRDLPSEAIHVRTDADRLLQVLINLITNARKYCDADQPELRISVRQRAGRVMIDIIDNGTGIPKESQSLIFEKFARLTDANRAGGAGLGLAICREIMTNLGGSVAYLPGQGGSAFRVTLPLRLEKAVA